VGNKEAKVATAEDQLAGLEDAPALEDEATKRKRLQKEYEAVKDSPLARNAWINGHKNDPVAVEIGKFATAGAQLGAPSIGTEVHTDSAGKNYVIPHMSAEEQAKLGTATPAAKPTPKPTPAPTPKPMSDEEKIRAMDPNARQKLSTDYKDPLSVIARKIRAELGE
jgi:hypothetical protein